MTHVLTPEERLKQIRERRAALDTAREEPPPLEEQLAREERELADAEALAKAEAQFGRVGSGKLATVKTPAGLVILKRAGTPNFKRFMDLEKVTVEEAERLARPCVIHPSLEAFDRMCDDMPALIGVCADAVATLAGAKAKTQAGKL